LSTIVQRTITGIIFLAILIGSIIGGPITFFILFGLIAFGLTAEFIPLFPGISPLRWLNAILVTAAYAVVGLVTMELLPHKWLFSLALAPVLLFLFELFRKDPHPLENLSVGVLSWIYLGLPLILLFQIGMHTGTYQYAYVLGFFILTWLYDTMAYVIGISIGKRRLFERVSPKKSWEGFIGGVTTTLLLSYFVSLVFPQLGISQWVMVALIASLGGTLGDLTESKIKREFEIKDTGKILPGHGGLLDRFDSILASVPIYFVYLQFVI